MELSDYKNIHVISGTNIPLILDFILSTEEDLLVRIDHALKNAKEGMKNSYICESINSETTEEF